MKTAVKDFLLILLFAVTVSPVFAGLIKFSDKGLISDGKFAPVQVGVGLFEPKHLFYTNQPTLFSLGFFGVKQRASIITLAAISQQKSNYGIPLALISLTEHNYGLMTGLFNGSYHDDNHGVKVGLFNVSGFWGKGQFIGIDFCDYLHVGIINYHVPLQIGVVNVSEESLFQIGLLNAGKNKVNRTCFQIGLLNYNPDALIPWMPFINWSMKQKQKPTTKVNQLIVRQLERNKLEPDIFFDQNQNGEVVCCFDFEKFPQVLDKKSIFTECSDDELRLLFNAVIYRKPLDFDIIREICKMLPEKGYLVQDKLEKIIFESEFDYSNHQMLFAYLGSDKKYEAKTIELLDTVPADFRDGLFIACDRLNTPAITRKLFEKFTREITENNCYGAGTGEDAVLKQFIKKWERSLPVEDLHPEFQQFKSFAEKNWAPMIYEKEKSRELS